MSNRFFNFVNQFVNGAVVKSAEVNTQFSAVETAMAAVELELNRAIKFPSAESATNQVITPNAASRIGYLIGYDANGALVSTNQFLIDWDVNSKRMRNLVTAVNNDEPVTLGQLAAYSASLVTGLPTISAQDGPLVTDGATVSWGERATTLLPAAPSDEGGFPVYAGGAWSAVIVKPNLQIDPNGALGTGANVAYALVPSEIPYGPFWHSQTSLSSAVNETGRYWTNTGALAATTFTHRTNAAGYFPATNGQTVTISMTISATLSAGTVTLGLYTYNAGGSTVGTFASDPITVSATPRRVSYTHAAGVYNQVRIGFSGVTCDAGAIVVKDIKVEAGSTATPFSDDATINWITKHRAQYNFGFGQTTPIITLGNASSTTSTYDFRSTTGSQAYDVRIRSTGGTDGTAGKGALAITAKSMTVSGPVGYASEYDAGVSGAAKTIDFLNGSRQKLTLDTATPAITISTTGLVVGHYQLKVVQDPTTARVPTWVGFVAGDCAGNALPTMTTTLSGVMFLYLYWDGTQFWVNSANWD